MKPRVLVVTFVVMGLIGNCSAQSADGKADPNDSIFKAMAFPAILS